MALVLPIPQNELCQIEVKMITQQKQMQVIAKVNSNQFSKGGETIIDLAPIVQKVARLELVAKKGNCQSVMLAEAAIVMPGAKPKIKRGKAPKNVLFWMIDNARADR